MGTESASPSVIDATGRPALALIPEFPGGRWWVAHTRPRSEKAFAQDLSGRGVFYYLPLQRRVTVSRRTGRTSRSLLPLFPGYVFLYGSEEHRRLALTTNRIANLLDVHDPARLLAELRQIERALASGAVLDRGPALDVGAWARIVSGPMSGLEGVIAQRLPRLRLALSVHMLSQSVVVEVAADQVEAIEGPSYWS
jgi:transcription antitermination factor NusG